MKVKRLTAFYGSVCFVNHDLETYVSYLSVGLMIYVTFGFGYLFYFIRAHYIYN